MAVNYGGMPNHVQIGINDTPLTSALGKRDFKTSEKLIEENEEPSYLNEGPVDKIPLALVLSSEAEFREFPRHLRLARLLVEGGANPNIRIPQAEWQGASPSPLEYVCALYDRASDLCSDRSDSLLLEELKTKYEGDKSNLTSKVQELQSQKPHLEVQLVNVTTENNRLQVQVKTLDKLLKRTQHRCEELQNQLVTCQVSRDASKRQLQRAMTFAEELVAEQENLLHQLHAKQEKNNSIARLGTTVVYRMGSMKTKLKTVQKDARADLNVIEKHIRQQETDVERMKDEYHRELLRLRNLIKQKEIIISRLQQEKTKTQEDLEVVWRAATSEDLHIKEKLKQASFLPE